MSTPHPSARHSSARRPGTRRRYQQLDVFADRPGAGNALGVVFDASGLDDTDMQAYAAWANLSETIFFLPPGLAGADYRIRIFTPRQELSFAGHPSVGAAWAALESGLVDEKPRLIQECAAGLLPVHNQPGPEGRRITVRAPRAHAVTPIDPYADALEAAVHGLPRGSLPPALWNNGPGWWLLELADARAVREMQPDYARIAALTLASGAVGLAVFGLADNTDHALAVRAFCPADQIPEDPVTGSVNACIAAALLQANRVPGDGRHYVASQGRELGRDGRVEVTIDSDGEVWIGGRVQLVIDGSVTW